MIKCFGKKLFSDEGLETNNIFLKEKNCINYW